MTKKYTFRIFHNLNENNLCSPLAIWLVLLPKPEFVLTNRCRFSQHFALLAIQIAIKVQPDSEFVRLYSEEHTFSKPVFSKRCFSPLLFT